MPWPVGPVDTRVKLDDLATPDDNRDLNATALRHGLMPKLSGSASDFLNGKGLWGPAGGAGTLTSVIDSLFTIIDDVTPGKVAMFQCAGLTAGTHTYSFPPSTAATTVTLAALELAQTFTQPQTVQSGAAGSVALRAQGAAGQSADIFQALDSTGDVLTGIDDNGDIHGGDGAGDTLVLRAQMANTSSARIRLTAGPGVLIDAPVLGSAPYTFNIGAAPDLDLLAVNIDMRQLSGNNSKISIDNRGGSLSASEVSFATYRSQGASTANLAEWRDEVAGGGNAIMSRIRFDGAFVGPLAGTGFLVGYVAKTANYTATTADCIIDCTANSFTVTLPTAVGVAGRVYYVKNSGTGTITVDTTSAQTIDDQTTQTVLPDSALQVASDGANWMIV